MKYKKVPTAGRHTAYALGLTLLVSTVFFLINPERAISLSGAAFLVVGAVLGYFGINWSRENKQTLRDAQREIVTCTEIARRLKGSKGSQVIAGELSRLHQRIGLAERDMDEASNFEETVARVSFCALAFVVAGTILQAVARSG